MEKAKKPSGNTPESLNLLERVKGFKPSTHGLGRRGFDISYIFTKP
jgi:hypothetical protein